MSKPKAASTSASSSTELNVPSDLPSASESEDIDSTKSSMSDDDLEDNDASKENSTSIPVTGKKNTNIEADAKPACPSTINHIINAVTAVGTFGGLALIITGGMGNTLNKPIDNAMENMAMILSGGALLVGSWVGNVAYANHQSA